MSDRPKKWPHYALESAENTLALLDDFDRDLRRAQELMLSGDHERAQMLIADARVASRRCVEHISRALTGDYKREGVDAWQAQTESRTSSRATSGTGSPKA